MEYKIIHSSRRQSNQNCVGGVWVYGCVYVCVCVGVYVCLCARVCVWICASLYPYVCPCAHYLQNNGLVLKIPFYGYLTVSDLLLIRWIHAQNSLTHEVCFYKYVQRCLSADAGR